MLVLGCCFYDEMRKNLSRHGTVPILPLLGDPPMSRDSFGPSRPSLLYTGPSLFWVGIRTAFYVMSTVMGTSHPLSDTFRPLSDVAFLS